MEDWEIVSEAGSDCSSWEIAEYPGVAQSEHEFSEMGSEGGEGMAVVAANARARHAVMMHLQPGQTPTEVQRVKRVQKPSVEVVKGGKHWQNKQALLAKSRNKNQQQHHRRSKMQKGSS